VLRARDALAKFSDALPASIRKFDDPQVTKISGLLDAFREETSRRAALRAGVGGDTAQDSLAIDRLATKAAPSKNAADIAATPYAITVSMVLDRMDDNRSALRVSLRNERILVAKSILTEMYDTEYALQVRIDRLDEADWGKRLQN